MRFFRVLLIATVLAGGAARAAELSADSLIKLSGVQGGLVVHLECGDRKLLAEFAATGRFLAHGLTSDPAMLPRIRRSLADAGLAGVAAVESLPTDVLPYADNLVSLLVADDLKKTGVKLPDILRVLRPKGVACLGVPAAQFAATAAQLRKLGVEDIRAVKAARISLIFTKPRPKGMDDWTHWNHGPDGNLVSMDQLIERPNQIQWIAGPQWYGHRGRPAPTGGGSPSGMLSANGRNYYTHRKGGGHQLVARDAFSGLLLWTRDVGPLNRTRLVASDSELYLLRGDEIVALDGVTGKDVRSFGKAGGCRQLILARAKPSDVGDGVLLSLESKSLRAFIAATGKVKWSSGAASGAVVKGGKVFATRGGNLACLGLADGWALWTKPIRGVGKVLFAFGDKVLLSGGRKGVKTKYGLRYTALSAKDGTKAWSFDCDRPIGRYVEAYFASGLVWLQTWDDRAKRKTEGFHNPKGGVSYKWVGLDPKTGAVKRTFLAPVMLMYACYPHWATDRFQIGIRPVYFTDWKTGAVTRFEATRQECGSNCGLGQGMVFGLYVSPTRCMCVRSAIGGITAFTSDRKTIDGAVEIVKDRLVKGPAYAKAAAGRPAYDEARNPKLETRNSLDWPMYRRDMQRSGAAPTAIAAKALKVLWTKQLLPPTQAPKGSILRHDWLINKPVGDPVTQPTVSGGKAFVALTHAGQIVAMDAATGAVAWRFFAPARLDAPPSIYRGLCLFGCNDGWVYCLRASDGKLVWRFRAAPAERRVVAYGQVESAWPVVGGVLMIGDRAHVVAGRTTETDGGLYVFALDPTTGKAIWSKRRVKPDDGPIGSWNLRGHRNDYNGPSDVLSSNGKTLGIAGYPNGRFDVKDGARKNDSSGPRLGWMRSRYARQMKMQYLPLAVSSVGALSYRSTRDKKTKAYHHFVAMSGQPGWKTELTAPAIYVEALALAGDVALAAISNGPTVGGGELRLMSAKDGTALATHKLPAAPAFDGIAIASGKVYVALQDGRVMCLGTK
jgi:outer membrane protein assembly factor BamB